MIEDGCACPWHGVLSRAADGEASALREVGGEVRASTPSRRAPQASTRRSRPSKTAADRDSTSRELIAALVLWPGLVAALYGADVSGLPGQGSKHVLLVVGITSAAGALVLLALLFFLRSRDT